MRPSTRLATAALAALACVAAPPRYDRAVNAQEKPAAGRPSVTAPLVDDFQVNGTGDHASWSKVPWTPLRRRQPDGHPYDTRFKTVYSTTGIYFLVDGTDRKLTATMAEDFMDLWNEDVFEVFLWTDERHSIYFEYEISPLNRELPILDPELRRPVPRLASLALREGSAHPEGDVGHRRPEGVGCGHPGMARRVLHSLHRAAAVAECATEARHAVAAERLPDGLRRREADAVGLGAGRQLVPRISEVRGSALRKPLRSD